MLYRGSTERMEVVLDTEEKVIRITQKWRCNFWNINRSLRKWTEVEKKAYKKELRSIVQSLWSEKAYAIVNSQKGTPFNEMYGKISFPIKVNIEFVSAGEHWVINIGKVDDVNEDRAFISWQDRQAYFSNYSIEQVQHEPLINSTLSGSYYWEAGHEFGHMLGNTSCLEGATADEYPTLHPLHKDMLSIMNLGCEIRHRHFTHIRDILQSILPGTYFCIRLT